MAKHLYSAVGLAAVAALVITGCGSGDSGKSDSKIAGAQKGSGQGHNASPSASATVAPNVDFKLPKDVHVDISADKTGDKQKDAILAAQADILTALESAYTEPKSTTGLLNTYFTGDSLVFYRKDIASVRKKELRDTGTYRYFNRRVTTHNSGIAVVKYCGDQSKVSTRHLKTGHVDKMKVDAKSHASFTSVLQKQAPRNSWQEQSFASKPGASECQ